MQGLQEKLHDYEKNILAEGNDDFLTISIFCKLRENHIDDEVYANYSFCFLFSHSFFSDKIERGADKRSLDGSGKWC